MKRSGDRPFEFIYREDLHALPKNTIEFEHNLHGGFAGDRRSGFGPLYYGLPGCGLLRIDPDLRKHEIISLPVEFKLMNFHSTKLARVGDNWRLILPANNDALVAFVTLEGDLDFVLSKPEFEEYQNDEITFAPTDTVLVDQKLFIADGYGANYITSVNLNSRKWDGIFGGKTDDAREEGKFATAHGINLHYENTSHLVVADRPSSRIQVHGLDGTFITSHVLPKGSWPCGIDYICWEGRWIAVIGNLVDPDKDRPAPIYIVDANTFQVISTVRPKEDLGIEPVQHLHNVVWHVHEDQLYLVCQSWNPGYYFVLERI